MQKYLYFTYYSNIYLYKKNIEVYISSFLNNLDISIIKYKSIYKIM